MPLYDFRCSSCGEEFEDLCERDAREVPCLCGGTAVKRPSFGLAAFRFDGAAAFVDRDDPIWGIVPDRKLPWKARYEPPKQRYPGLDKKGRGPF